MDDKHRFEIVCPCCNKRLYIRVSDADQEDLINSAIQRVNDERKAEQEQRKKEFIDKYGEETYNRAQQEINEIFNKMAEGK